MNKTILIGGGLLAVGAAVLLMTGTANAAETTEGPLFPPEPEPEPNAPEAETVAELPPLSYAEVEAQVADIESTPCDFTLSDITNAQASLAQHPDPMVQALTGRLERVKAAIVVCDAAQAFVQTRPTDATLVSWCASRLSLMNQLWGGGRAWTLYSRLEKLRKQTPCYSHGL